MPSLRIKLIVFLLLNYSFVNSQSKNNSTNHTPVFVQEMNDTTITVGKSIQFTYKAEDLDKDSIRYFFNDIRPRSSAINSLTGQFSWRPSLLELGKNYVQIIASDGKDSVFSKIAVVTVLDAAVSNGGFRLFIETKPEAGGITLRLINNNIATLKARANKGYRFLNWTSENSVISTDSTYSFIFDNSLFSSSKKEIVANFRINRAPVFVKEMPDTMNYAGELFVFQYKAIDPDGDYIKYFSPSGLPIGAILTESTGIFYWRPQNNQSKKHEIVVEATDGFLSTFSRKTAITVYSIGNYLTVTVVNNPLEGGELIPTQLYPSESYAIFASVKAIPKKGFRFFNWTEKGVVVSTDSIYTFLLKDSKTLVVNYLNTSSTAVNYIPTNFNLSQNYPNPFNPETTIEYTIPVVDAKFAASTHVTLKLYDVLGREVATLVDEHKQPGNYKININVETRHGASLPSGVYYYRLLAGNFSQTKKLVLMK